MAKIATTSDFEQRLIDVIVEGLKVGGIRAKVETEPVHGTRLTRVHVTARGFDALRPTERQDLVWRIVGQAFDPDDQLRISMILTLTPDELAGKWRE